MKSWIRFWLYYFNVSCIINIFTLTISTAKHGFRISFTFMEMHLSLCLDNMNRLCESENKLLQESPPA